MKKINLIIITLIIILSSCDIKTDKNKKNKISETQENKIQEKLTSSTIKKKEHTKEKKSISITETNEINYDNLTTNEIVLKRLQQMKNAIEHKNKEKLLQFFDFPIELKEPLLPFIPYHILLKRWSTAQTVTKKDFFKLVKTNKGELYTLLNTLDLTLLKNSDSVEKNVTEKGDFCLYIYSISINNDKVTLMYGTNTSEYAKTEEDFCPESNHFITFKIIENRLVFDKYIIAG